MTERQRKLLAMLRADIAGGYSWTRRMITAEAQNFVLDERISWEEGKWLSAFIDAAILSRIEAARIVADVRQRTIDDAITARIEADRRVVNG